MFNIGDIIIDIFTNVGEEFEVTFVDAKHYKLKNIKTKTEITVHRPCYTFKKKVSAVPQSSTVTSPKFKEGDVLISIKGIRLNVTVVKVDLQKKHYHLSDDLGPFSMTFEQAERMLMLSTEVTVPTSRCQHKYQDYIGFTESYKYCIFCDSKMKG